MSCAGCCRKPRHKRLVDALYPQDPLDSDPVAADLDKLLYLARSSPDHLDDVGGYLAARLRRSLARDRRGHVRVSLKIMEKLLSEVSSQRVQLLADSYLEMIHEMLQCNHLTFQILAANSFVAFTEHEEESPPYHRQYDFFIQRFAAMSLVSPGEHYFESRLAGLRALCGVVKKVGPEASLQLNIWDTDHLNKIIPAFLLNMQLPTTGEGDTQLVEAAETGLKQIIAIASLSHAAVSIQPVLDHFDLNTTWLDQPRFASDVFVTIIQTMQVQVRHIAIQSLLSHLDSTPEGESARKRAILEVLSQCVGVAADGSIGPSVLDVFTTLLKHLRGSISSGEQAEGFHETVVRMVGEFVSVLPDFHTADIMNLIISYLPYEEDGSLTPIADPLQDKARHKELVGSLIKCLQAVADSTGTHSISMEGTFPESLLNSLTKLMSYNEPSIQLKVLLLWQKMVDHHDNHSNIPLHTNWSSLDDVSLTVGKVSSRFLNRTHQSLWPKLVTLASSLHTRCDNLKAFYTLMCLIALELGQSGAEEVMVVVEKLQEIAIGEESISSDLRAGLQCTAAGVLRIVSLLSDRTGLVNYIDEVLVSRRNRTPLLLPDTLFKLLASGEKREWSEDTPDECLFELRERGFLELSSDLHRNPNLLRESSHSDSVRSFRAVSMDSKKDQEAATPLTFHNLKQEGLEVEQAASRSQEFTPSFQEMVIKVSQAEDKTVEVADLIKSINPTSSYQQESGFEATEMPTFN